MGKNLLLMFSKLTFNETEVRTQKFSSVSIQYFVQGKLFIAWPEFPQCA